MVEIIDGKFEAKEIRSKLGEYIKFMHKAPGLAVVLVGEHKASALYVRNKHKMACEVGINSIVLELPIDITQVELVDHLIKLNNDDDIHGILVQLPLPDHIDKDLVIRSIDPNKDVDCFHPNNLGRMFIGQNTLLPCTPLGCLHLIKKYGNYKLAGSDVVVVGKSNIVGKPMSCLLLNEHCTVSILNVHTTNVEEYCSKADILVVAAGSPRLVKKVKSGAMVIDVGINYVDGKIIGDVDFDLVKEEAGYITPVPGGVGPMTIACLLVNVTLSCVRSEGLSISYKEFLSI